MNTEFETLIKRITPKLNGITHKLNGHFTYFNDDDLYQEALEHLWIDHQIGKLNDKTDSYVLQGCYFHLKNYIRTAMDRAPHTSLNAPIDEDGETFGDLLARDDHAITDVADEALLQEELDAARLNDREKTVLAYSLEGLTSREIGAKLGVSHVMVLKIRKSIEHKCSFLRN